MRKIDTSEPGLGRRRAGRGFVYVDEAGRRVRDPATLERIAGLVIPPAWEKVWICADPDGHIQATGVDARGRKQYRYHTAWRRARDRRKHDRAVAFAKALPVLRRRVTADLRRRDLSRPRVLAAAARLLERGLFRVGGEEYAQDNGSFGLATVRKEHVRVRQGRLVFDYPAKSGQRRRVEIADKALVRVIGALKRRRGGGPELLAYKADDGHWVDIRSEDINDYLRESLGPGFSSKDFRTWTGTVLAAVELAGADGSPQAIPRTIRHVADQLGDTPAVARGSYVDPRVVEGYEAGTTADLDDAADRADVEAAVVDLLEDA